MAAVVDAAVERRRGPRVPSDQSPWRSDAVLRPGLVVRVINIGPRGVLVESAARLRPGRRAELQLLALDSDGRRIVAGRIERCQVVGLEPLCFQGAIAFEAAEAETLSGQGTRLGEAGIDYP